MHDYYRQFRKRYNGGGSLRARPYNNEKNACRYEIIYALTYVTITNLKFITDGN